MQEKKPELDDDAAADDTKIAQMVCSLTNREECMACGSWGLDLGARKDVTLVQVLLACRRAQKWSGVAKHLC